MEKITKRDGVYYYGDIACSSANEAYCRFRSDYHESLGTRYYSRLNREGCRKERLHGFGVARRVVPGVDKLGELARHKAPCRILGFLGISYCRITGCWDWPEMDDDTFDIWSDYVLSQGNNMITLLGRRDGSGRTSKILRKRFR